MRRTFFSIALAVAAALSLGLSTPASAAPKVLKSTITWWAADVGSIFGAGYAQGEDLTPLRQACKEGKSGSYDGYLWRFFDLKGTATKFKVSGPKPTVTQSAAGSTFHDYDLDMFAFDAKCNRIDFGSGMNTGGGIEKGNTKKPASFIIVVYWQGHSPNIPVTLEVG